MEKFKKTLGIMGLIVLMTACGSNTSNSTSSVSSSISSVSNSTGGVSISTGSVSDSTSGTSTGGNSSVEEEVEYIFKASNDDYKVQYSELREKSGLKGDIVSTGDRKLLVIPVEFKDYTCAKLTTYGGCQGVRDDIQASFFGEPEDTAWQSVGSFYEQSSYGNLRFTGEVTPWYKTDMTVAQLANRTDAVNPSQIILRDAVQWYKNQEGSDISQYDTNDDGYVDAVWLVYAAPYRLNAPGIPADSDLYWAFVYWDYNQLPGVETPNPYAYAWASYAFMYDDKIKDETGNPIPITDSDGNVLPDAHTWIHETGHLLGLEDYYTYDDSGDYAAAAALDMMDNNIGDHNAFSKSILRWIDPIVVKGPGEVTISPFESSGDALLVKKHWDEKEDIDIEGLYVKDRGGILDEYLMIEFYTPTGLNQWDSEHNYAVDYPRMFTEIGIKIYHIDARIGGFFYSSVQSRWVFRDYTDILSTKFAHHEMGNSNTRSRSGTPDFKLIHLLESSGVNSFINQGRNATATNETLFQLGDTFGYEDGPFAGFTFNSKLKLGLKFSVTDMDESGATIVFESI